MLLLPPAVRWCLDMSIEAEVHDAHAAALRLQQEYGMQEVKDVTQENGQTSFLLCDMDANWWEICHRPGRLFDTVFDAAV